MATTTPLPAIFDALPTPPEGGTPIFFRQNDHKRCSLDYLDSFGHFFGVAGEILEGGPLGKMMVKNSLSNLNLMPFSSSWDNLLKINTHTLFFRTQTILSFA